LLPRWRMDKGLYDCGRGIWVGICVGLEYSYTLLDVPARGLECSSGKAGSNDGFAGGRPVGGCCHWPAVKDGSASPDAKLLLQAALFTAGYGIDCPESKPTCCLGRATIELGRCGYGIFGEAMAVMGLFTDCEGDEKCDCGDNEDPDSEVGVLDPEADIACEIR